MRLPWVSRADFDWLRQWMLGERKFFEDQAIAQAERYDALLEKYHALLQPPAPVAPIPAPAPEKKDSVIAKTIRAEAGGDPRLAAHFWKRVKEIKAEHPDWEDSQVADELAKWDSTFVEAHAP